MPQPFPSRKILIAPLDWGLGHATRSIPIIREFLNHGCEVQIASSGGALILLKEEFPALKFHELVSYKATYAAKMSFMLKILLQMPRFLWAISEEHRQVERIVRSENIDWVISDNRYGCWSRQAPSVLITHQINILVPLGWKWLEKIVNAGNRRQIKKFTHCWVPDFPDGMTGKMTQHSSLKVTFIGMISRFESMNMPLKHEILFLFSGPEPQRTILEAKMKSEVRRTGQKNYFVVKGKPGPEGFVENEANHLPSKAMNEAVVSSELVISRSGYTTIMDLCRLGKNAIFIPTPGQTEQEYLAEQLKEKGIAFYQNQNEFDLTFALAESKKYKGFAGYPFSSNLLTQAVDDLLKRDIRRKT